MLSFLLKAKVETSCGGSIQHSALNWGSRQSPASSEGGPRPAKKGVLADLQRCPLGERCCEPAGLLVTPGPVAALLSLAQPSGASSLWKLVLGDAALVQRVPNLSWSYKSLFSVSPPLAITQARQKGQPLNPPSPSLPLIFSSAVSLDPGSPLLEIGSCFVNSTLCQRYLERSAGGVFCPFQVRRMVPWLAVTCPRGRCSQVA